MYMTLLLNIIFFCLVLLLSILVVARNPARLPGFDKARNESLDRVILLIIGSLLLVILGFKCR